VCPQPAQRVFKVVKDRQIDRCSSC
jgi:hypothetical protein